MDRCASCLCVEKMTIESEMYTQIPFKEELYNWHEVETE